MIRTRKYKPIADESKISAPSAILAADLHLRDSTPICREEQEFFSAQWGKFEKMIAWSDTFNCPIIVAGDFFHNWKASPWLLSKVMEIMDGHPKARITCIYGQHDLPNHNYEDRIKSGLYTLSVSGHVSILESGGSWGRAFDETKDCIEIEGVRIAIIHELTYVELPWSGCKARSAFQIINDLPTCQLIVTGDNHQTFTCKSDKRMLINPGSMTRQKSDQKTHKPCVFFWYAEDNSAQKMFFKTDQNVIKDEHIVENSDRAKRIEAFISKLSSSEQTGISFEANLRRYLDENNIAKDIQDEIYKSLEDKKPNNEKGE